MIKTALSWFFLIIIFSFLFSIGFIVFEKLFLAVESEYIKSAIGAFMGAFLAFIFVRIGDGFKLYHERKEKNHSALVKYQHYLNGALTEIDDNIFLIDTFEEIFSPDANNTVVWSNRLKTIPIDTSLIHNLLNIDLINEIFSLNIHLKKLNSSCETSNRSYDQVLSAFLDEKLSLEDYNRNVERIKKDILDIRKFLYEELNEIKHIFAVVRILGREQTFFSKIIKLFSNTKYTSKISNKVEDELEILESEIENIKKESQNRIDNVLQE